MYLKGLASLTNNIINKAKVASSTPQEIAESFVNGNISWVKKQIDGNIKLFNEVLTVLEETGKSDTIKSFRRIMAE